MNSKRKKHGDNQLPLILEQIRQSQTQLDIQNIQKMTPLHRIAFGEECDNIELLVTTQGEQINATTEYGHTALHIACYRGLSDYVKVLLNHGADVKALDRHEWTSLHMSVLGGHGEICQSLLQQDTDNGLLTTGSFAPLHLACATNTNPNVLRYLFEYEDSWSRSNQGHSKAQIELECDVTGWTPLHVACMCGHMNVVDVLVERGANVAATDNFKCSPLHYAAQEGHINVLNRLIELGADVNSIPDLNICHPALIVASDRGHVDVVRTLLDNGVDIHTATWDRRTALHRASQEGRIGVARLLIERNHNVDVEADRGLTPLHLASEVGHLDIVKLLLDSGASIAKADEEKWTALHAAACKGHSDVVRLLLERGAEVDAKVLRGGTPLLLASEYGHVDVVDVLLKYKADIRQTDAEKFTALHWATQTGHCDVAQLLVECGADLNLQTVRGSTPLMLACEYGHLDTIRFLLSKAVDVNAQEMDGWTCLHWALYAYVDGDEGSVVDVSRDSDEDHMSTEHNDTSSENDDSQTVVRLLLSSGADVNAADDDGKTPIHFAAEAGRDDDVQLLAQSGANVSWQTADGHSSLMLAAMAGHLETCKLLVKLGADNTSTSSQNFSAAQLAILNGHTEVYEYLIGLLDSSFNPSGGENQAGQNETIISAGGLTVLHEAVRSNKFERVLELLKVNGLEVNATDFEGNTPLHVAAGSHLSLTQVLVEGGANVNYQNMHGISPLHVAVACDQLDVIQYLLENGADVAVTDNWRLSPLYYGTHLLDRMTEEVRQHLRRPLVQHQQRGPAGVGSSYNDDNDLVDELGNNALHRCMCMKSHKGLAKIATQHVNMAELVLRRNPSSIQSRNIYGHTPLHLVRSPKLLKHCIPFLPDDWFECKDHRGRNFWHLLFCRKDAQKLTQQLLSVVGKQCLKGVMFQDDMNRIPLHYNAMHTVDDWLLEEADYIIPGFNIGDIYGRVPLTYAAMYQNSDKYNVMLPYSDMHSQDNFKISVLEYNLLGENQYRSCRDCGLRHFSASRNKLRNFNKFIEILHQSPTCLNEMCLRCHDDEVSFVCDIWRDIRHDYSGNETLASQLEDVSIFDSVRDLISSAVSDLIRKVGELDERFCGIAELAGSVCEETKVDCCDEFDFLVVLPRFSEVCEVVPDADSAPGYVQLAKQKDNIAGHLSFDGYFTDRGILDTHLIKFKFEVLVKQVLSQSDFHKEHSYLEFVDFDDSDDVYCNVTPDKPSLNVKVKIMKPINGKFVFHTVSVDIVPALCVKNWWPPDLLDDTELIDSVCPSLGINGCHLIFDQPHRKFPGKGYSQHHARVDFAMIESYKIRSSSPVIRAAYMVSKKIVKNFYRRCLFKSYVLKAAVLQCIKEERLSVDVSTRKPSSDIISESELTHWVQKILRRLLDFVLQDFVPSFAMPAFILPVCHFEKFAKFSHKQLALRNLNYSDLIDHDVYFRERNRPNGYQVENIAESYLYTHIMYWSVLPRSYEHKLYQTPLSIGV